MVGGVLVNEAKSCTLLSRIGLSTSVIMFVSRSYIKYPPPATTGNVLLGICLLAISYASNKKKKGLIQSRNINCYIEIDVVSSCRICNGCDSLYC